MMFENLDAPWTTKIKETKFEFEGETIFRPAHEKTYPSFYDECKIYMDIKDGKLLYNGEEIVFIDDNTFYFGEKENLYYKQ